jgi:hypothetical protein
MTPSPDTQRSGLGLALGEAAFLWMGALVGPMLILSAIAGAAWGVAVGVIVGVVLLGVLFAIVAWLRRAPEPRMDVEPRTGGARATGGDGPGSRLLIAAGEAASSAADLPAGIRSLIKSADEVLVISPVLPGRAEWLASSTDKAREQADERLRTMLGHLDEMGAGARGAVGADDPLLAFEDAIRQFRPDHLLIGLRAEDRSGWQEEGLLDQVQQRFGIPTTVFQFSR